jgi:hypothetical protein
MIIEKWTPGYVIQVFDTNRNCFIEQRFKPDSIDAEYYSHETIDTEELKRLMHGKGLTMSMLQPRPQIKEGESVDCKKNN